MGKANKTYPRVHAAVKRELDRNLETGFGGNSVRRFVKQSKDNARVASLTISKTRRRTPGSKAKPAVGGYRQVLNDAIKNRHSGQDVAQLGTTAGKSGGHAGYGK